MSEDHSNLPASSGKPAKPYPAFPLTAHPAGYWCKKIRQKLHYLGPRFDAKDSAAARAVAQEALDDYNRQADANVADEAKDQPAADYLMGHEVPTMSSIYREAISDLFRCYRPGNDVGFRESLSR